jgi:hypothetical protein
MKQTTITQLELMGQHLAACKASGKTVGMYYKEKQLKSHIYYYWRKKMAPNSRVNL